MVIVDPTSLFCPLLKEKCLGSKCALFVLLDLGGWAHGRKETGCAVKYVPEVLKKIGII